MEIIITGGIFRGRKLQVPNGINVRPTMSFIREAVFSSLGSMVKDSTFLDLYAGFGTVGIEALSRGAKEVTFVEKNRKCMDVIKKNLDILGCLEKVSIYCMSVENFVKFSDSAYEIIYLDPPYNLDCSNIIREILSKGLLANSGIIIWETSVRSNINRESLNITKEKRYGESLLIYIKKGS
ncbi:MAG: 16S rRNA (guanine(966)-N(2))-methyltransferase RsmD [bacterium]|nr:16S rRNA (guanine(966)-N(2))-methyltransferase RsmD [bacterium]